MIGGKDDDGVIHNLHSRGDHFFLFRIGIIARSFKQIMFQTQLFKCITCITLQYSTLGRKKKDVNGNTR